MYRWACSVVLALVCVAAWGQWVPLGAAKFQRPLTANARMVWGLSAPIATFAAQIHQESAWRPDAQSPYAQGLAQFTPDTAKWIAGLYTDLEGADVWNPAWALLALVRYDRWLWERLGHAANECERMAMVLASYNGGLGHVNRETRACKAAGAVSCPSSSSNPQTLAMVVGESFPGLPVGGRGGNLGAGAIRVSFSEKVIVGTDSDVGSIVLRLGHALQVAWRKVRSIFVDVVDENGSAQSGAKNLLGNKAMHISNGAVDRAGRIPVEQENSAIEPQSGVEQDRPQSFVVVADKDSGTHCGCDSTRWFGNVENICLRASWACRENREYPKRILYRHAPLYQAWGPSSC